MPNVKTAISLPAPLFKKTESLARKLKVSRSRFFAMAAQEFIERYTNAELLTRINDAWKDGLDENEKSTLKAMRRVQRHLADAGNEL